MKILLLAFCLVAVSADEFDYDDLSVNLGDLPMQNPDLFQGDILDIESVDDRNAIPYTQMRWPNGVVPYVIDSSVAGYTNLIQQSMQDYMRTCIRFQPRRFESNYINIFAGQGCYSNVGMVGRQQPLSLGQGCMYRGTIVHELGHAIGFFHEQNRSDRDDHLIIYWQNIQQGMADQFALLKPHENLILDKFDYNSIMLYGNTAFSKDGRSNTMVAKTGQRLYETYDKQGMSNSDVFRVNKMYNC